MRGGADLQAERVERLALGIADRAGFRARLLLGAQALAEQAERDRPPPPKAWKSGRTVPLPVPIFQVGRWPVSASF